MAARREASGPPAGLGEPTQARRTAGGFRVADDVLGLIGSTPLVRLGRLSPEGGATLFGKCELLNPAGSVKDRPALGMVLGAERTAKLAPGATLIEATSGNTGISLAMIAAVRGYRCVLVMPEDMSLERRYILRAYGAEIVLTQAAGGMSAAVAKALELLAQTPGAFMPSQFDNPDNPESHARSTALELIEQTGGQIAAFVAGVGTGGTVSGVGRVLKATLPSVRVVAVEPQASAVLSGKSPGPHGIQGLGAGFVPKTFDRSVVDQVVVVSDVAAERMARRLAREEGLLVGPSSGANVHAAAEVALAVGTGTVVTILCDSGERYLF
ncbi:MAG: cysteine synthase A [Myxococcales bacterium]|nr:cysteine synthase A [Myxococcales bacterium]